jgi:5-methylcytosine-specific restriction endonuclease McrA
MTNYDAWDFDPTGDFLRGGDLFAWHLAYQQTDEFRADEAVQKLKETAYAAQAMRKYNAKHPTFRKLREEARQHRYELLTVQGNLCHWCKASIGVDCHIDHKVPLIKGGDSRMSNLCATCSKCNYKRRMKMGRRSLVMHP